MSRTRTSAESILLTKMTWGMWWSSMNFSSGVSATTRSGEGSQTSTAASHHRERRKGIVLEFDRARDIEEGPLVAEIVDRGDVDLGTHAALARLGGTVADRGACARRAAPADGPRGVEDALEQAGLAREIRPAQRHHAVRAAAWSASRDGLGFDVVHDNVLPSARSPAHESSGRWSLPNTSGAKPCPGNRFTPAWGSQSAGVEKHVRRQSSQRN